MRVTAENALFLLALSPARALEGVLHRVVPLVAGVLVQPVRRIAVQWNRDRPRTHIHLRIVDSRLIVNRVGVGPRKALDDAQLLGLKNSLDAAACRARRDPSLVVIVRRLDDERVSFPAAARIAF